MDSEPTTRYCFKHPFYRKLLIPSWEVWKWVLGYKSLYKVSNWGRVKSIGRWRSNGMGLYFLEASIKKLTKDKGRTLVNLTDKKGRSKVRTVSHLVLEVFVGYRPDGTECCHKDGNCHNNRLENLRWDTHLENEKDKKEHGTGNVGERNRSSRVDKKTVLEIRRLYMTGKYSYSALSKIFGFSPSFFSPIITGYTWNYPDCYPDGYVPPKRSPEECFKGVNRWTGRGCKENPDKKGDDL